MQTKHSIRAYIDVVHNGISKHFEAGGQKKKVIIVGAGLAGLSGAYELFKAGHEPLILEAQHRIGGRIYTMREPFSRGLYGEAGAMRIPRSHELMMAYIHKFGLQTCDFPMGNPRAYVCIGGIKRRLADVIANPDCMGFEVAEVEKGKISGHYWEETIRLRAARSPYLTRVSRHYSMKRSSSLRDVFILPENMLLSITLGFKARSNPDCALRSLFTKLLEFKDPKDF